MSWDVCCTAALGLSFDAVKWRGVDTLSGGEQKRLVLEALLRGPDEVLLLDEPDNYLDVPGKQWLEERLAASSKTVLLISHDRELLRACADAAIAAGNMDDGDLGRIEAGNKVLDAHKQLRRRLDRAMRAQVAIAWRTLRELGHPEAADAFRP